MQTCSVERCDRHLYCKGLCKKHHNSAFLAAHPGYANRARRIYREKYPDKIKANRRLLSGRFSSGKTQAKQKKVSWTLTLEEYSRLIADNRCFWCKGKLNETGSGLDRLDNRQGYDLGNVVPCCWRCNTLKGRIEGLGFEFPRSGELLRELFERKFRPAE